MLLDLFRKKRLIDEWFNIISIVSEVSTLLFQYWSDVLICFFYCQRNLIVVATTTTKRVVIMKAKGKQLTLVCSIKLAVGYTYFPFVCIPSKHRETFSSTTRDPKSELPMVQVLGRVNRFPICKCQAFQRSQRLEENLTMLVYSQVVFS